MTIQYHKSGNYYLPNLVLEETEAQPIGKYGRMRKQYLKEHRPVLYSNMLLKGRPLERLCGLRLSVPADKRLLLNRLF